MIAAVRALTSTVATVYPWASIQLSSFSILNSSDRGIGAGRRARPSGRRNPRIWCARRKPESRNRCRDERRPELGQRILAWAGTGAGRSGACHNTGPTRTQRFLVPSCLDHWRALLGGFQNVERGADHGRQTRDRGKVGILERERAGRDLQKSYNFSSFKTATAISGFAPLRALGDGMADWPVVSQTRGGYFATSAMAPISSTRLPVAAV